MDVVHPVPPLQAAPQASISRFTTSRLLAAPGEHAGSVRRGRVDLLVRNKGRHVDESPGSASRLIEVVAPAHARTAADHVNDAFETAMMMRAGHGIRVDRDRARPSFPAPVRALVTAAARFMPGVCGV